MTSMTGVAAGEVERIRALAQELMDFALGDECEARRQRWRDANERRGRNMPPVWCRPAGAWREILPESALECRGPATRRVERVLLQHLYKLSVGDDHILEPWWAVPVVFRCLQPHVWGLPTHRLEASTEAGGFRYSHPVAQPGDYARVRVPEFAVDRAATARHADWAQSLFGEVMPVRVTGSPPLGPQLGTYLEQLRGLLALMEDLVVRPSDVHRVMALLTEGVLRALRLTEDADVLTRNHGEPMFCSDPIGGAPADGEPVRLRHLWTAANSQEFDQVSPGMQQEFLLSYQQVIFQQFGAVQYGCCENLTEKIPYVLRIPNLRVFVCSFWTDLARVIEGCGTSCTIMWRQSAAQCTLGPDLAAYERHLGDGLRLLRGHHYQIVLREIETLDGRPERLRDWVRTTRRLLEKVG